jgi:hypothetical protein
MNPQRYRLQGVRYANGEVSLQARPQPVHEGASDQVHTPQANHEKVSLKVAS